MSVTHFRRGFALMLIAALMLIGALMFELGDGSPVPLKDAHGGAIPPGYVGNKACGKCHFKQRLSFARSKLAKAFLVLKPGQAAAKKQGAGLDIRKDYSSDPTCLSCHTTGYGTPTGYPTIRPGRKIDPADKARAGRNAGVTCEACHGPGSLYSGVMKRNKKFRRAEITKVGAHAPPSAAVCAACHRPACPTMPKNYKFDFAKLRLSTKIHTHKALKYPH